MMKIAVLRGPRAFEIVDEPIPTIEPDQVLVRVAACGVCTSELDVWEGKAGAGTFPRYPGHEVSGIVSAIGEKVTGLKPGDPVGVWAGGRGFAEYVAVQAEHCYPAGDLPLDEVLIEPLACAVNAVELANPQLGDDIVLIGAGFMGSLLHKLLALRGPHCLIVADARTDVLQQALRRGADRVVNVRKESLPAVVKELTGGKGADLSFEVTGLQAPLRMLGEITRMSGKVAIVGYHQDGDRSIPLGYWNWMAFQIVNAHFREMSVILHGMRTGMRLLSSRKITLSDLVTHRYSLEQVNLAFATACAKPEGFMKAVICL